MDRYAEDKEVINKWKFGSHKKFGVGDRVFLSRTGKNFPGLIGSGKIISEEPRNEPDIEDPKTGLVVRDVGTLSRDRHIPDRSGGGDVCDGHRGRRIGNIDHRIPTCLKRYVRVISTQGHALDNSRQRDVRHEQRCCWIGDIGHDERRPTSEVEVVSRVRRGFGWAERPPL